MINDTRRTREIKYQDCHCKRSIQKEEDSFHQQTGLKFKEQISEMLYLEHSVVLCWKLDTSEIRSEILGKFSNVVLEKNEKDQLDRLCCA
jgi:hypothetical protein